MPSTVGTSTTAYATSYPFQRKSFYANGYHYVIFSDGLYLKLFNSPDGVTWTDRSSVLYTRLKAANEGRKASLFYSPSLGKFDIVSAREASVDRIIYDRFTPNADGTVSHVGEMVAVPPCKDENGHDGGITLGTSLWTLRSSTLVSPNIRTIDRDATTYPSQYTTKVNIGSYAAGNKFVFTPYSTVTASFGTTLPATIQNKGWMYGDYNDVLAKKLWSLDGKFTVRLRVKNPDAIAHAGNLYVRLWKSANSDMSGASALCDWASVAVSFSGTAGQILDKTINLGKDAGLGDAFILKDEYLYIELLWDVTTAATNARVQIEAEGYSQFSPVKQYIYYPCVTIDSDGYPWIGFGRYNGVLYYFYVIKGDMNDGTFDFRNATSRKLKSPGWSDHKYVCPVPLTSGKMLVIYGRGATYLWSQYWDGSTWGTEVSVGVNLCSGYDFSVVAKDDTVELVYLEQTSYDVLHRRWTADSWSAVATIETDTYSLSYPVLAKDGSDLYCFYATKTTQGALTAEHIYYRKYSEGAWGSFVDWIDESSEVLTGDDRLTCFYEAVDGKIGLEYMTKTASPYNVRFDFLTVAPALASKRLLVGVGI